MRRSRSPLPLALLALFSSPAAAQQDALIFDAAQVIASATDPIVREVGDFDGDGDPDAFGLRGTPGKFHLGLYLNDGGGAFPKGWSTTLSVGVAASSVATAVGDLDGDGIDDFGFYGDGSIHLYRGDVGGAPQALQLLAVSIFVEGLAFTDLNGDGRDDVLVLTRDELLAYRSDGAGVTFSGALDLPGSDDYESLAIGEFTGDGVPDCAVGTNGRAYTIATAGGVPSVAAELPVLPGTYNLLLAAGDVDGDGRDDVSAFTDHVTIGGYKCGKETHFLQTAPGVFVSAGAPSSGGAASDYVDVDLDGDLDGVQSFGTFPFPTSSNSDTSHFRISLNDGAADLECPIMVAGVGGPELAGARDLDADGDVDLIAGRSVFFPRDGFWSEAIPGLPFASSHGAPALDDYDRDGDPDGMLHATSVLENDGTGALTSTPVALPGLPMGAIAEDAIRGDWDGDGDVDLLVTLGDETTWMLANAGGGVFQATQQALPIGVFQYAYPIDTIAFDLNGDGDMDLLASYASGVEFWANDGTGAFTFGGTFYLGRVGSFVDLTGDGLDDALVSMKSVGVGYRRNLGQGYFDAVTWFPGVDGRSSDASTVGVADLDDDGDLDVLATNDWEDVLLLENDGTGGFTAVHDLFAPLLFAPNQQDLVHLVPCDFDGDGILDVLQEPGQRESESTLLYRGNGPGQPYTLVLEQKLYLRLRPIPADVDADGDVDLLGYGVARNLLRQAPQHGLRLQYGAGLAGANGHAPKLGHSGGGVFEGQSGSLVVSGATGGAPGVLAFSTVPAAIEDFLVPGLTLYVDPFQPGFVLIPVVASGSPGVPGAGRVELPPFLAPIGIAGLSTHHHAVFVDPGSETGLSATNALQIVFGEQ